ncbi:MAG TPA: class I SAM-dependent methyltransferase [Jiangellales bacterium]|nr:class I SAM-dependent methyltransferase [Jiangellales bacterium]
MTGESDPYVVRWDEKVAGLVEMARDDRPWYDELAGWLLRPGDRVAVDVGCGGGGMTLALAAAMGADGQVVAVDAEPDVLAAVRDQAAGDADRLAEVTLVQADLGDGVEAVRDAMAAPADVIWASASVHHVGDQQRAINALASLLAPDGRLALAEGGLPARHLPWDLGIGAPGLEQRLDAANDRWFTRMREELPGSTPMPYGWPQALRRAGLTGVTTRTFLRERPSPLGTHDTERVIDRFARWVDRIRPTGYLEPSDRHAWDRLLDPADPAWLGHRSDLFSLEARSVHVGERTG